MGEQVSHTRGEVHMYSCWDHKHRVWASGSGENISTSGLSQSCYLLDLFCLVSRERKLWPFFYYFIVKILWFRTAAGTVLRPKPLIHQPQEKQQSSKAIRACVVTQLNSLDPQSNVLESSLVTEAILIWPSVVLSTSNISSFTGILQLKQEFSRQF